MMKRTVIVLAILALCHIYNTQGFAPYNGGNLFTTVTGNPALASSLVSKLQTQIGGAVSASCNEIEGVGFPILAIRQALQIIDTSLDNTNRHTYGKTIYFQAEESKRPAKTTYKLVIQIKTIKDENYIAVEGEYRERGHPPFKVITYYFDTNLENIEKVMGVKLDKNAYVGCGDVKKIYSQKNPVLPSPNYVVQGNQTHPHNAPYGPGAGFNHQNSNAFGSVGTTVNTAQLAQILASLGTNP